MLLYAAFGALFVSLVPVGLLLTQVADEVAIRCGSAALLLAIVLFLDSGRRGIGRLDQAEREVLDPRVAGTLLAVMALAAVAQLATAIGITGSAGPAILFFGLLTLLVYAAFGFVRLMFVRPHSDCVAAQQGAAADRQGQRSDQPR